MNYDHKIIEPKWQKIWEKKKGYKADDFGKKPKFYALVEFPYPSGEGLHLGHAFTNVILDILVRKKRMSGFNVLYPMGWDAFGLPTENYAIKTGVQPALVTRKNTDRFRKQMKRLAFAYNWDREINTTDPDYYKWTQWIFLKFFEKGLAYKAEAPVGWCPKDKIILANEEIVDGKCERCGTEAEHRMQKQWMLRITAYADRLADELDLVDYPESVKLAQKNWIGRKTGSLVKFSVVNSHYNTKEIEVFTTRIDTIFGVTFIVISPEHPLAKEVAKNSREVAEYLKQSAKKTERERMQDVKKKTGIDTKLKAVNPVNNSIIPIWISDFVVSEYGTGGIMGVPAHDERDNEFAKQFSLPIKQVIKDDYLIDSGKYTGLASGIAKEKITLDLKYKAKNTTIHHLRDWIFSRQHYWGEPIPIIECEKCGLVPVPEKQLPLVLPKVKKYQPTETGESPLSSVKKWVNTTCPRCGGKAKRETDTMPNWAGSSWYFIRYADPKNKKSLADLKKLEYWMPVDLYLGGAEHTTLHLLYSRFWHKFLNDLKLVPGKEPYAKRRQHGIILAEDGTKMSKSKGNVINPDDLIDKYGCDVLRTYLAFMGPYDQTIPWSTSGIEGSKRFINRIFNLFHDDKKFNSQSSKQLVILLNKVIGKVSSDIDELKHNTAIASLMTFLNAWEKNDAVLSKEEAEKFLIILSPFVPHLSEELWRKLKNKKSIFEESWPEYDRELLKKEMITLVIQVNGKLRGSVEVASGISEEEAKKSALENKNIKKWIEGRKIIKVIFIPNKLVNIVL